jgi:putative acetyltransferase
VSGVVVRDEREGDEDRVRQVLERAFGGRAEARLVAGLRRAGRLRVALVAECDDDGVVGHVAFSPVTIHPAADDPPRSAIGLAPLAVLPDFQRRGIGEALVRAGLERVRSLGEPLCVVLGDPAYYGRFGFTAAHGHGLRWEHGGGAAFQCLELAPGAAASLSGIVRYAPEFDDV